MELTSGVSVLEILGGIGCRGGGGRLVIGRNIRGLAALYDRDYLLCKEMIYFQAIGVN